MRMGTPIVSTEMLLKAEMELGLCPQVDCLEGVPRGREMQGRKLPKQVSLMNSFLL